MTYRIARNGQLFGPYTAAEVERYLASGQIVASDLAQADGASAWTPVGQVFAAAAAAPAAALPPPVSYAALPMTFPDPPNLPWVVALLLGVVTLGAFFVVWDVVLSAWLRRIDRSSTAVAFYLAVAVVYVLKLHGQWTELRYNMGYGVPPAHSPVSGLLILGGIVLFFASRFVFRRELLRHFNGPEPVGLRLGWWMTLFFGGIYFQYHLNRINQGKQASRVGVPNA